jgi:Recombination endonuclease VII
MPKLLTEAQKQAGREANRKYRAAHPDRVRENQRKARRKYKAAHLDRLRENNRKNRRKYVAAHPDRIRESWCKYAPKQRDKKFGNGAHAHLQTQIKEQHHCCAICGHKLEPGRHTHLDHNHLTGQWRGALCSVCNTSLGGFREDTGTLRKAIWYLQQWRRSQ